jgi:hypothetical protein
VKTRLPITFWLGAGLILACEALLVADVRTRGVTVLPAPPDMILAEPEGAIALVARWVAINLTPLCWVGFLLLFDGVLTRLRARLGPGSPARTRPRRFTVCFVTSVGVWLFFDWVNFFFIHAWDYHWIEPLTFAHEYVAKLVAFGAISPAMFMAAELFQQLGLRRVRGTTVPIARPWQIAMFVVGVPAFFSPFVARDPVACFGLWVSLVLIFDPLNHWLGRGRTPTLIGDWQAGRWGRTLSLMLGGLTCGVLWEFWNYWAAAKWTYDLPFLGPLEQYRLFEMPLPGFAGFGPFALECWVIFQTILLVMATLRLRLVEPLPDDDAVL